MDVLVLVIRVGQRMVIFQKLTPILILIVRVQAAIALVRRIHDMGITIVIVEHIMEVIMTLTKRVLVFNQGHVIASGTPNLWLGRTPSSKPISAARTAAAGRTKWLSSLT